MKDFRYMRSDIDDVYGIVKLQDEILGIMVYIDRLCKENNITYFLMGGSALGAVRHSGFIPWDDDLDIFIPHYDYFKFIEICESKLNTEQYYFQKEDSEELPHFFCKIRKNNTAYIEKGNVKQTNMHQGIFVDIMCLNNAAPTLLGKKMQYYCAGLLKANALTKLQYETTSVKKKMELFISKIIVRGAIKSFLIKQVRKYNNKPCSEMAHLFGRAKFKNSFYPKDDFSKQVYVDFETVSLAIPNGYDEYLTIRFGRNYMEMPSKNVRDMYEAHAVAWSTTDDYNDIK